MPKSAPPLNPLPEPSPRAYGERVRVRGSANLERLPFGRNGPVLLLTSMHAMFGP